MNQRQRLAISRSSEAGTQEPDLSESLWRGATALRRGLAGSAPGLRPCGQLKKSGDTVRPAVLTDKRVDYRVFHRQAAGLFDIGNELLVGAGEQDVG